MDSLRNCHRVHLVVRTILEHGGYLGGLPKKIVVFELASRVEGLTQMQLESLQRVRASPGVPPGGPPPRPPPGAVPAPPAFRLKNSDGRSNADGEETPPPGGGEALGMPPPLPSVLGQSYQNEITGYGPVFHQQHHHHRLVYHGAAGASIPTGGAKPGSGGSAAGRQAAGSPLYYPTAAHAQSVSSAVAAMAASYHPHHLHAHHPAAGQGFYQPHHASVAAVHAASQRNPATYAHDYTPR